MALRYFHVNINLMRTHGGRRGMHRGCWWESQNEDLDVGGRIILKFIVDKWDGVVLTGFIWLGIGASGWLL
jgi:hypothetical protein